VEDSVRVAYQEVAALLASAEQTSWRSLGSSDLILVAEAAAVVEEEVVERHPQNLPLREVVT
jgi:hypothetical protein